jgi:hypothetical protein
MTARAAVPSVADAAQAVEAAEAALARWSGEAVDKANDADRLAAELAEAQARCGDDLIDDDDPDAVSRIAGALLHLQTQQAVAVRAAEVAEGRLTAARREVLRARAGNIRARAVRLREAAAARQARTDQLVAELQDWERVTYAPAQMYSSLGVVGQAVTPRTLTQNVLERAGWLEEHAGQMERVADRGDAGQVAARLAVADPEQVEIEHAVAAASAAV